MGHRQSAARHPPRRPLPHRQRLRHAGLRRHGRRFALGRRAAGGPAGRRSHASRRRPAPRRQGQARHLPVHERRAVAGRQLRSEADAGQVPRPAAARRRGGDRAQDRRADAVAVRVLALRQERARGQRAVPARRRLRRRHLRDPVDAHRHPESRAVDADDEHRPHPGGPAVDRARGSPTGSAPSNQNLPGYVVLCPDVPTTVGPPLWNSAFLPAMHQGTFIPSKVERPDQIVGKDFDPKKLVSFIHNKDFTLAEQRRELDLLEALDRLQRGRGGRPAARGGDRLDGDRLPDADRGARGVRHPQGDRRPRSSSTARAAPRAAA